MIEVFDPRTRHMVRRRDRERLAALAALNLEAKKSHEKLAQNEERGAMRDER